MTRWKKNFSAILLWIFSLGFFLAMEAASHLLTEGVLVRPDELMLETALMVLALVPALYLGFVRPLLRQLEEKRQAEAHLRESEARLRLTLEGAEEGIWDWSSRTGEIYYSPRCARMLGYGPNELDTRVGPWMKLLMHPDDRGAVLALLNEHLAGKATLYHTDVRLRTRDGQWRWFQIKGKAVVRDDAGRAQRMSGTIMDVHQRKLLEEMHQEDRRRLNAIFQGANDGIAVFDGETRFRELNLRFLDMLDYNPSELLERRLSGLVPDAFRSGFEQGLAETREHGAASFETEMKRGDGSALPADVSLSCIDIGGEQLFLAIVRDISSRRRGEQEARRQRALLESLINSVPDYIFYKDLEGRYLGGNRAFCELTGLPASELPGKTVHDLLDKAAADALRASDMQAIRERKPHTTELWVTLPNGTRALQETQKAPILDHEGRVTGIVGISRDLTERRRAERRLAESEALLRGVFESAADGIVIVNSHGTIESANPAARRIFGHSPQDLAGAPLTALIPPEHREAHEKLFARDGGAPAQDYQHVLGIRREVKGLHRDGTVFPMDLSVSEVSLDDRTIFAATVRDISERKKVERLKKEFVSTVSHELRTPLTSIHGSLGLLHGGAAGDLPEQSRDLVEIAYQNSGRLIQLINDILDIDKIESGKMPFWMEPLDLSRVVAEAVVGNAPFADRFGVRIRENNGHSPAWVQGDFMRLGQVMNNLLSNAAKYSPPGSTIDVGIRKQNGTARVFVRDRGPGVQEEFRERIFERFAQADATDSREKGGTGLGLAITKAIVEKHGGTVGFDSAPGRGSTFYFELPLLQGEIYEQKRPAQNHDG